MSLYRQRIPDTKYIIYEFDIAGHMAFDGSNIGLAILDSNESFSEDKVNKLPLMYFVKCPTMSSLKMIKINYAKRWESDTLLTAINQYSKKLDDVRIEITEYNNTYGSATTSAALMEYQFDGIKETNDSLFLFNVIKIFGGKTFPGIASFTKGNIKVVDSTGNNINYFEIDQPIIQRSDIYKPGKPFELVPNRPVVGVATYRFYPKTITNLSKLTDYGIFKRLK